MKPANEQTTLDHLADAIRMTNRALQAKDEDQRDRLLKKSNMHLLLMEAQMTGLFADEVTRTAEGDQMTVFDQAGTGLEDRKVDHLDDHRS